MSSEELMIPRIIVINDFYQSNFNPFKKGDILRKNGIHFTRIDSPKSIREDEWEKYPAIFKELNWWEYRELEDFPKYIKRTGKTKNKTEYLEVTWKTDEAYYADHFYQEEGDEIGWYPWQFNILPATEEEYNNFINNKQC